MFKLLSLYSDTGPGTSSPLVTHLYGCVVAKQRGK